MTRETTNNRPEGSIPVDSLFENVTPQDQGTYLCLAANAVGEAEQRVQVRVRASSRSRSRSRSRLSPSTPDLDPLSSSPREGDEHAVVDDSDEDDDDDDGEDPCAVNPCHNGGTCLVAEDGDAEVAAAGRRARCHCLPDYHGSRCQFQRRPHLLDAAAAVEDEVGVGDGDGDGGGGGGGHGGDSGHTQSSTSTTVSPNDVNNNNNMDFVNINKNVHVGAAAVPPKPTLLYPLITTSDTANGPIFLTPQSLQPRPSSSSPLHHHDHHDQRNTYLRKKHRRKYATPSGGVSYGIRANKASGSGAPQLKVKDCPPRDAYCLNGGTCKLVVKLQRRFCQCPRGFAGRRCEQRVL